MNSRIIAFGSEIWHNSAVPVWLERFALVVLAAAFSGIAVFNVLKMDGIQRTGIGIAILGATIYIAQTIHIFNQSKAVTPTSPPVSAPPTAPAETAKQPLKDTKKSASQSSPPVERPVQDIHRPQQETIAGIIRSAIPENEPILVLAATTPEQLDTFARKITGALKLGGMNPELGTSNHLRPGIVIQYNADKKDYADTILDAFVKARVPGPITMQPGSPPRPLTIVISSTD
jgi:hypothetical protein